MIISKISKTKMLNNHKERIWQMHKIKEDIIRSNHFLNLQRFLNIYLRVRNPLNHSLIR